MSILNVLGALVLLMGSAPAVAGDLVIKQNPHSVAEDHNIPADAEMLKKMNGALDKLTNKTIGE